MDHLFASLCCVGLKRPYERGDWQAVLDHACAKGVICNLARRDVLCGVFTERPISISNIGERHRPRDFDVAVAGKVCGR
jgi:hypothetical protein